jgi:xanthine dehydrogenase YagS FAD-binding subunit
MATLGGNLCQDCRCWYYRASRNYFHCLRKKEARKDSLCYAVKGDHRYHSIFGAVKRCLAVNPGDTAPALIALNARIKTTRQTVDAEKFFSVRPEGTTILENDEIVVEIQVPAPRTGSRSRFLKYAFRKAIDFPIVNCAAVLAMRGSILDEARICLNGVYNLPYRPSKAETVVRGQSLDETIAARAAEKALEGAIPMPGNKYMVAIARALVKRVLLSERNSFK